MPQVRRCLEVSASRDEVWRALTDRARRAAWLGGDLALEPYPGAVGTFVAEDGTPRHARVERVWRGRGLRFCWWSPNDDAVASVVDLQLESIDRGTRITVIETLQRRGEEEVPRR